MSEAQENEKIASEPYEPYYCGNCGMPVEYCKYGNRSNVESCREFLRSDDPDMFSRIYPDDEDNRETLLAEEVEGSAVNTENAANEVEEVGDEEVVGELAEDVQKAETIETEANAQNDAQEEEEEEEDEEERIANEKLKARLDAENAYFKFDQSTVPPFGIPPKCVGTRNWKSDPEHGILQIRLAMRGKKKGVTQVWGYHDFPEAIENLDKIQKDLRVRCACSVALQDVGLANNETCLSVQGNFITEVVKAFTTVGKVPRDQIFMARDAKVASKKKAKYAALVASKKDNGKTEEKAMIAKALAAPPKVKSNNSHPAKPIGNVPRRNVQANQSGGEKRQGGQKHPTGGNVSQRNAGPSYTAKRY